MLPLFVSLFAIFTVANFGLGVIIYIILASIMPTKEEIEAEMYGTGPRKRKEAQVIDDNEGWFGRCQLKGKSCAVFSVQLMEPSTKDLEYSKKL